METRYSSRVACGLLNSFSASTACREQRIETTGKLAMSDHKQILLVEDGGLQAKACGPALTGAGYDVVTVAGSAAAELQVQQQRFELVVVDLDLPDNDGWRLADRLNATQPSLPVLGVTARAEQELQAAMAGIDLVLSKPINAHALVQGVMGILTLAEQEELGRIAAALRALKRTPAENGVAYHEVCEPENVAPQS